MKSRVLGPLILLVAASAWGEAPRVPLAKGFTPNPMLVGVQRAEGGAQALETTFAACKDVAAGAQVSKAPAAVLEVPEGITHLTLQASHGDRVVARTADGVTSCGEKLLTLEVKPGALEVFVVTAAAVPGDAAGKLRVFDADRPRILPDAVKTVAVKGSVQLSGELLGAGGGNVPDAQLDVTSRLEGVKWELSGAATEVWLAPLSLEDVAPVKAGETLAPGRYAVWIRGTAKGAYEVKGTGAEVAASTPPASSTTDALQFASKPAPDAAVQARTLSTFMPNLDPEALKGWSQPAQALRKRAFTELPAEFFVFAAADGEVLLPLSTEGEELNVIAADGAAFSMRLDELATKPANGPLVRPARSELIAKLTLADLASEKDPKVKAFEKLKAKIQGCIDRHPDWPDAPKRCNLSKVEKAQAKLEADLKKAYAKKRAVELAAVQKRMTQVIVSRAD